MQSSDEDATSAKLMSLDETMMQEVQRLHAEQDQERGLGIKKREHGEPPVPQRVWHSGSGRSGGDDAVKAARTVRP